MKLIYRTKGNSTPQGKPRVYFTGHPADLPAYREEIFADIFQTQSCAIYYDEEPLSGVDQDDLLRELEQMQLIVIPVTSRFLYQPNRARDVEFPFAMKHHIPILPLMQENGLESAFNEQCGDLQMLNKSDPDPTALPFAEKLEKFLASALVGDELAEKVRAAFDAYVFLSYRKKDRKYAQELMRLIHKNDFCRDIAIWYDEFLTPGENFNEAIADAMNKCRLFTLAVTPNVLETGNYVMSLEYPEAKRSGKPILPVELVPTDKDALQSSFQDIPPCTDAHDEHALSAALLEAMKELAIRENDGSPEHNFFIGLAYLNGIDVEVDRARALSLITGAAENHLPEAMEKLVAMYRSGDGVQRNYRAAIQWQERLVHWRQKQFERSGAEEDGKNWVGNLRLLGNYHKELADLSAARRIYQQMLDNSMRLADQFDSAEIKRYISIGYESLGNLNLSEGRLAEAKDCYLKGLELDRRVYEENPTAQGKRDLSFSNANLGKILRAEGRLAEAKDYFSQGLELRKQLAEETGTAQARRDLSISCNNLGDICKEENRLADAKDYYLRGMELSKQLAEETGTAQARRDLSVSYDNLGNICGVEGKTADAKDYYLQSLELNKQLAEETGTVQARRDLFVSYSRLGNISKAERKTADAKNYYLQSLELSKQFTEETGTVQARRDLSISYDNLGSICETKGKTADAKDYYLQSLELSKQLAEETGTVQARQDLSVSYDNLGSICETEGKTADAKDYYLQSLELSKQLAKETGTLRVRRDLSVNYNKLGNICKAEGNPAAAKNYYLQGLKLRKQLAEETGTVQARQDLSVSYNNLGNISKAEGRLSDAKEYYLQCLELHKQLAEEIGTVEERRILYFDYDILGGIHEAENEPADAENYYLQSLELSKQLADETEMVYIQRKLALIYDNIRLASEAEQDNRRMMEYSEKLLLICTELYRQTGTPEDYGFAANAQLSLGLSSTGTPSQKKTALSKAYEIWCELAKAYPNVAEYTRQRKLVRKELKRLKRPKWRPF